MKHLVLAIHVSCVSVTDGLWQQGAVSVEAVLQGGGSQSVRDGRHRASDQRCGRPGTQKYRRCHLYQTAGLEDFRFLREKND